MFPDRDAALECLVEETFTNETSIAVIGTEVVRRVASARASSWVQHLEGDGPALAVTRVPIDAARIAEWLDLARRAIAAPLPKDDGRRGRDGALVTLRASGIGELIYSTSDHDDACERHVLARTLVEALVSYTGGRLDC